MRARLDTISEYYTHGNLVAAIRVGLAALGKTIHDVSIDDLAPIDEFHIGGRKATQEFLDQLDLRPKMHVLDVGCGLGGAARLAASRYGCRVAGIDLTHEYVETGRVLCEWLGLNDRVSLYQRSALATPFLDRSFDAAYMLHVGMNIEDKARLCAEVARVLRPGRRFGVYDVMQTGEGALTYPVPWAANAEMSAVAAPDEYKDAMRAAGFAIIAERNRRDLALAFFEQMRAKISAGGGAAPLGLHILMGKDAKEKVWNMIDNVSAGRIAPVEIIARKL